LQFLHCVTAAHWQFCR